MLVDLAVLVLVAIFSLLGALWGALLMGVRACAAAGAAMLARPVGELYAPQLEPWLPWADKVAVAVAGAALWLLFSLMGRLLVRGMTEDRERRATDRGVGAFVGAGLGLFVAWLALSAVTRIGVPLPVESSFASRIATEHGFFDRPG